jgi:hypothetical protein
VPISHRHKAIFIHVPKAAGTSIEAALGMHGHRSDVGVVPYLHQVADHEHLFGGGLQHMTATQLRAALNDDTIYRSYFKFAVVRNPWERLVSALAWTDQKWAKGEELRRLEFEQKVTTLYEEFVANHSAIPGKLPPHFLPQHTFVCDHALEPLVDFVAKYENLAVDWSAICARLGVNVALPRRMRSHHRNYWDYYCDDTRRMVGEIYARDARVFQYEF